MSTARCSISGANSSRPISRSPVAMAQAAARRISASPAVSPGCSGSSTNIGRKGSSTRIYCSAALAEAGRPWKSIMISVAGPAASRSAAIAVSQSASPSAVAVWWV